MHFAQIKWKNHTINWIPKQTKTKQHYQILKIAGMELVRASL